MSSESSETRTRILSAARKLVEQRRGLPLGMGEIAAEASVSRQALYLHFANRTQLLLELTRWVDASHRTPARQAQIDEAPDAQTALREAVTLQIELKPHLRGVIEAFEVLRRSDPDAQAAWTEREEARRRRCESIVERLISERALTDSLSKERATDLFWVLTSQQLCDMLTVERSWSASTLRAQLLRLLELALLSPQARKRGARETRRARAPRKPRTA